MGLLGRVLVAGAIVAGAVLTQAQPAFACTCGPLPARRLIRQADATVAGHVVDEQVVDPTHTRSLLAVDGVYRGDVGASLVLVANIGPGGANSCSVLYPVGSSVDPLLLTIREDGAYEIMPCALVSLDEIRAVLGAPLPPPEGAVVPFDEPPPPAVVPSSVPDVGGGLAWPAVAGGLILAIALIALTVRRSSRGRVPAPPVVDEHDGHAGDPTGASPSD
jgi:hypothetical protein